MSITLQELAIYLCWGFTDLATNLTEKGLFRKHGLDSYEQEVI